MSYLRTAGISIFDDDKIDWTKMSELANQFEKRASISPKVLAVAPARVNIVGDYTDHNWYPVIPMTVDKYQVVLAAVNPDADYMLAVYNEDPRFRPIVIKSVTDICGVSEDQSKWYNYVLRPFVALAEYLQRDVDGSIFGYKNVSCNIGDGTDALISAAYPHGLTLKVFSQIPIEAGLGSSSALIVALFHAYLQSIKLREGELDKRIETEIDCLLGKKKTDLARLASLTESCCSSVPNDVDPYSIILGGRGKALKIECWNPKQKRYVIQTTEVQLPDAFILIYAHTGYKSTRKKGGHEYNQRILEMRIGSLLLYMANYYHENEFGIGQENSDEGERPEAFNLYAKRFMLPGSWPTIAVVDSILGCTPNYMIRLCLDYLKPQYSSRELNRIFSPEKLSRLYEHLKNYERDKEDTFFVRQPVIHAIKEAERVGNFSSLCFQQTHTGGGSDSQVLALGTIMNESQTSMAKLLGYNIVQATEMIAIAKKHNSLGARMIAAGWGESIMIACRGMSSVSRVIDVLIKNYYERNIKDQEDDVAETCFDQVLVDKVQDGRHLTVTDLREYLFILKSGNPAQSALFPD